jgi:hypothetical protein
MGRIAAAMRDAGIDQSEIDAYRERAMAGRLRQSVARECGDG